MPVDIILNPIPHADNWFIKKWLETPRGEFIDMGDYGKPYLESEITHAWIDDAKQFEDSKKKRKLKQQMPYWANNWRKK